jgi:hypothetical protein
VLAPNHFRPRGNAMSDVWQGAGHTPDEKPISAYPFHHTLTAERQRLIGAAISVLRALAVAVILAAIGAATALLAYPGLSVQRPTMEPGPGAPAGDDGERVRSGDDAGLGSSSRLSAAAAVRLAVCTAYTALPARCEQHPYAVSRYEATIGRRGMQHRTERPRARTITHTIPPNRGHVEEKVDER